MPTNQELHEIAQQLRVDSVRAAAAAGSGHPTSSMSAAELMAVLAARHLRYDFDRPEHPNNDHLIFSKGHASPLLYALYKACGAITDDEMLTFRKFGSRIEGHPTPVLPWVDVATGSLGQGLPYGLGIALAARRLEHLSYRVWVLCGDSEMAEGSMWEAFEQAGVDKLNNLTAIIDVNRLGQRGETMHGSDLDAYRRRIEAFGWNVVTLDGHDVEAVEAAYQAAKTSDRPTAVVAKTVKGKGVARVEDQNGFHGMPIVDPEAAIEELGGVRDLRIQVTPPDDAQRPEPSRSTPSLPAYEKGSKYATRKAYGEALLALGRARGDVVALDGEVANSTFALAFQEEFPDRFFEMYIAEQLLVATAVGIQTRGWKPFVSTFAAFYARAYDFVRMAAISQATMSLCGSHAGISIGQDGPSQMALEDLASFRVVHGSTVLYPCDANQTAALTALMADIPGISFLRTTRNDTPVVYGPNEKFEAGGCKVLRASPNDSVTVVGAGITLHEAIKAADELADDGISVRVIDLYSVKPVDEATLRRAATETAGRIVTVEDHWAEGGIGDAVLDALAGAGIKLDVRKLAVRNMPGSGTAAELMAEAGIDAAAIVEAARQLLKS